MSEKKRRSRERTRKELLLYYKSKYPEIIPDLVSGSRMFPPEIKKILKKPAKEMSFEEKVKEIRKIEPNKEKVENYIKEYYKLRIEALKKIAPHSKGRLENFDVKIEKKDGRYVVRKKRDMQKIAQILEPRIESGILLKHIHDKKTSTGDYFTDLYGALVADIRNIKEIITEREKGLPRKRGLEEIRKIAEKVKVQSEGQLTGKEKKLLGEYETANKSGKKIPESEMSKINEVLRKKEKLEKIGLTREEMERYAAYRIRESEAKKGWVTAEKLRKRLRRKRRIFLSDKDSIIRRIQTTSFLQPKNLRHTRKLRMH
ncbi:MAG: hypothetical protein AB1467_05365 [Candidatus Diapherotrites archaeon]